MHDGSQQAKENTTGSHMHPRPSTKALHAVAEHDQETWRMNLSFLGGKKLHIGQAIAKMSSSASSQISNSHSLTQEFMFFLRLLCMLVLNETLWGKSQLPY